MFSSNSKIVKVITISAIIFVAIILIAIGISKKDGSTESKSASNTSVVTTVSNDGSLVTSSSSTTIEETTTSYYVTTAITTTAITTTTVTTTTELQPVVTKEEISTDVPAVEPTAAPESSKADEPVQLVEEPNTVVEEYLVYKPSTHYIHKNTCHWNCDDAYRIDSGEGLEARLCTECGAYCEGFTEYVEYVPEPTYTSSDISLSDDDKYWLVVMLSHECSSRAGAYHNANAVACMVNRVRDGWASSIYNAIENGCTPYWGGSWSLCDWSPKGDTSFCYEAIDYYLANSGSYGWQHSWEASGDGITNTYS